MAQLWGVTPNREEFIDVFAFEATGFKQAVKEAAEVSQEIFDRGDQFVDEMEYRFEPNTHGDHGTYYIRLKLKERT